MEAESEKKEGGNRFELLAGLTIAVFAAILAINELGAGHFGDDEKECQAEKNNQYSWYQGKSIKQSLLKGQRDQVSGLMEAGVIQKTAAMEASLKKMSEDLERYSAEMFAIKDGYAKATNSKAYARLDEKHRAEFDKEYASITGAEEYRTKTEALGKAGDRYDLATLFLQLSLVLGAIGLVIGKQVFKVGFFIAMLCMGGVGFAFSLAAYLVALPHL